MDADPPHTGVKIPRLFTPTAAEIARAKRNRWILRLLAAGWTVPEVCEFVSASGDTVRGVRARARLAGTLPPPVPTRSAAIVYTGDRVSLLDAAPDQCRSLDADGLCCSRLVVPGRSWCREHFALYTQRSVRRAS